MPLSLCEFSTAGHGSVLRVFCVPSETLLEKADFSFLSGYQLEIASR